MAARGTWPALLAGALALSACSGARVGPDFAQEVRGMDPASFECCTDPEKFYPEPVARIAIALGNELGPSAAALAFGDYEDTEYPGRLTGNEAAQAAILAGLEPFDIVLVSNHSYLWGRLVPGRFSHSLVYLGTEAELRAEGLWTLPELAPYRDRIRAGEVLIEAAWPAVNLTTPRKAFQTDRALTLRPALTRAEKRAALVHLITSIGAPFNYGFGLNPQSGRFSCTELIYTAMPGIGARLREAYGETVLMPDDLAAQAVRGENLRLLSYIVGTEEGFARHGTYAVMVDLAAFWGAPDKAE